MGVPLASLLRKCISICDRLDNNASPDKQVQERPSISPPTPCQQKPDYPHFTHQELRLREVKELTQGPRGKKGD